MLCICDIIFFSFLFFLEYFSLSHSVFVEDLLGMVNVKVMGNVHYLFNNCCKRRILCIIICLLSITFINLSSILWLLYLSAFCANKLFQF